MSQTAAPAGPARVRDGETRDRGRRRRPRQGRTDRSPAPRRVEAAPALVTRAARPAVRDFESLPAALVSALRQAGIEAPFPIQAATLPDALAGENVLGRARTGAGKTLGFGLPMLARLAGLPAEPTRPVGLVLVPTRELAQQVADALAPLGAALGVQLATVYGGTSIPRQVRALEAGVHIVVATPGRLVDLLERGACDLSDVAITVLDEADHMCDLGFLPVVTDLLTRVPASGQRMLFSATLDGDVDGLVRRFLPEPVLVAIDPEASPVTTMAHHAFEVPDRDAKLALLAELAGGPGRTLLFVRTKHGADRLARQLGKAGVPAAALHGGMQQGGRTRALRGFASGARNVLVATDVAARGIHVEDVDLVVHADPPTEPKAYLHRSGRTARAGAAGIVAVVCLPDERPAVRALLTAAGITGEPTPVTTDDPLVAEVVAQAAARAAAAPARTTDAPADPEPASAAARKPRRDRAERASAPQAPRSVRPRRADKATGPGKATGGGPGKAARTERTATTPDQSGAGASRRERRAHLQAEWRSKHSHSHRTADEAPARDRRGGTRKPAGDPNRPARHESDRTQRAGRGAAAEYRPAGKTTNNAKSAQTRTAQPPKPGRARSRRRDAR